MDMLFTWIAVAATVPGGLAADAPQPAQKIAQASHAAGLIDLDAREAIELISHESDYAGLPQPGDTHRPSEVAAVDYDDEYIDQLTSGCGDAACGCGIASCCPCSRFLVGAETTFIWADLDGFRGSTRIRNDIASDDLSITNDFAEGDGFTATPRLWLTYAKGCWGVSGRYWNFSRGEHEIDPFLPPSAPRGFVGAGNLDLFTVDLQAERYVTKGCASRVYFIGVRHADFDASQLLVQQAAIGTTDLATASSLTRFRVDGTGLTFGAVGRRRMREHSNWNTFWNVRGSVLFGDSLAQASAATSSTDGTTTVNDQAAALGTDDSTLFIGEVQLGVERVWRLQCMPASAFFRVAGEYQYWDSTSDATAGGLSSATIPGRLTASANAAANDLQLDLFGLTIGTGLTW